MTKDVPRRLLGLYRAMTEKIVELNEGRGMTDALMARLELAHELTAQQGFCGELWEISEESPPLLRLLRLLRPFGIITCHPERLPVTGVGRPRIVKL